MIKNYYKYFIKLKEFKTNYNNLIIYIEKRIYIEEYC